jgi:hypothetical protein
MKPIAYTLEHAEQDLRGVYYRIRASRQTDWKLVNEARFIQEALKRMGIKKFEIDDARYCLKKIDCNRCNKNAGGTPCYFIGERRKQAEKRTAM